MDALTISAIAVLVVLVNAWIGKWLWNNFLVPAVPAIQPIYSIWDFIGLMLLFTILFGTHFGNVLSYLK